MRLIVLLTALFAAFIGVKAQGFEDILIDQDWLTENLDDDNLILLHVGSEADFNEAHIPGAQLITRKEFAESRGDLYWEIPDAKNFKKNLSKYGINEKSTIVLYYGNDVFAATYRLYYTLEYYGWANQTRILDGGLKGWVYKGLETTKEVADEKAAKGKFDVEADKSIYATKEDVLISIGSDEVNLLDARRPNYFSGEETGKYIRGGHIKNAKNITWLNLVDENNFLKSEDELRDLFDRAGIKEGEAVITYCHVGLRASMLYTISKGLGYDTKLYDGSFNEWDGLGEEYPTEGSK